MKPLLGDIKEPAEIGRRLIWVKEELVPGKFIYWIETFLEISVSQAENYMAAARVVKEFPKFGILARSAQYLLGAKGTPLEIKEEIAERLDRGEPVRYKDIHELMDKVYIGLDLSWTRDLTTLVLYGTRDGSVDATFWLPGDNIREKEPQDKVPYVEWAARGILRLCNGPVINLIDVVERLKELVDEYDCRAFVIDPWQISLFIKLMMDSGISQKARMVEPGQNYKFTSSNVDALERATLNNRIRHGNSPVLT